MHIALLELRRGTAAMTDLVGRRLGDFEVLGELGRGGMGVVYEARQLSLNRTVALKVLSGSLGLTARAVERFRREAEAAARLHHSNIVPVHATGEEGGTHYYAMERVEGPSLDKVIRWLREAPPGEAVAAEPMPSTVAPSGERGGPSDAMATIPCPPGPPRQGMPPPMSVQPRQIHHRYRVRRELRLSQRLLRCADRAGLPGRCARRSKSRLRPL